MDKGPLLLENFSNMKSQRVKVDESFGPALKDKAAEVADLLEPKHDNASVDDILCYSEESLGKSSVMDDFSYDFEFGYRTNYGGLDSFNTQGEDDLKLKVLDGLLDDVDEVDDFHAANDLSTVCEEFLLDIEFAENFTKLDSCPVEGSHLGNSSSESHSPGFSGNNVAIGMSDSSIAAPESECKNDSPDKVVICESHGTFKSKCECQVSAVEKSCNSHDVHRFDELDNDDNVLLSSILSECKRVKNSVLGPKVKRLRKPTQRYIEESSYLKSGYLMRGQNVSTATLKDKHPKVTSCNGSSDESNQVPSESWLRGGRLKKRSHISGFESIDDIFSYDSDDERLRKRRSKMVVDRRKNQRMWTLSEVMKLIDGISQFGVGKWTDIKRLLFSSFSHRTPIDLRDKWRNLLRASYVHQKNKGEVDPKHALRALPKSVLYRVRELATIHPYPRVPYSKKCNGDTDSSGHPTKAKSATFSSHGRNLGRKKHN